jgi:Ca2+-binding EF-hand superfamily protein
MATKDMILGKLQSLITEDFDDPKKAFEFFDKDGSGTLSKKEIVRLLKQAEISGFIRGLVASKLIEGYSKDGDESVSWIEFQEALNEISQS